MSDLEKKELEEQRDAMDGGFAVVDRERLIEEETREITPWYKHFIHVFTAPGQMMEECFSIEPTKGASIGVVGCILFMTIYMLLTFMNPVTKMTTLETLRNSGIEENALNQTYSFSMISGTIGGVIGAFVMALLSAVLFQIVKAILKDRCKFGTIYKMILIATMVAMAIQCVDGLVAYAIGMSGNVFSIGLLLSDEMKKTALGVVLTSVISLSSIISMIYMAIGYKAMTHTTIKKGITAVVIVEVISIVFTYFYTSWVLNLQSSLLGA